MSEVTQVRSPGGVTHIFQVGSEVTFCGSKCARWTVTLDPYPAATCKLCARAYRSRYGVAAPEGFVFQHRGRGGSQ